MVWRHRQGLKRTRQAVRKLENSIIPAAWADVESWVRKWRSQEELKRQAKIASATSEQILALIVAKGPQTPATVAELLPIPHQRAQKAMQRLNKRI
jgi:hypothetical protein